MDAETICENLGFSPEEAKKAHELVQNRMDTINNWEEKMTSQQITKDDHVHLHQLVKNEAGDDYVVTGVEKHAIELTAIDMSDDDMEWFGSTTYTPGDVIMEFEPQYEVADGQQIPVWAY